MSGVDVNTREYTYLVQVVKEDEEEGDMEFTWNDEQQPAQQQESGNP